MEITFNTSRALGFMNKVLKMMMMMMMMMVVIAIVIVMAMGMAMMMMPPLPLLLLLIMMVMEVLIVEMVVFFGVAASDDVIILRDAKLLQDLFKMGF